MSTTSASELERLVVRLMGDAGNFDETLRNAESELRRITDLMDREVQQAAAAQQALLEQSAREIALREKELEEAIRNRSSAVVEAARITESVATSAERYDNAVWKLMVHLDEGRITQETFNRAVADLNKELPEAIRQEEELNRTLKMADAIIEGLTTEEEKYFKRVEQLNRLKAQGLLTEKQHLDALKQLTAALPSVIAAEEELAARREHADAIIRKVTTAEQQYATELAAAESLLEQNLITQDQFNQHMEQLFLQLPKVRDSQKRVNEEIARGQHVTQSYLTVEQKHAQLVKELDVLLKRNRISQETYNRAVEKSRQQLPEVIAQLEQEAKAFDDLNNNLREAYQLQQKLLLPAEQYRQKLEELNRLHRAGFIGGATYAKGLRALNKEYSQLIPNLHAVANGLRTSGAVISSIGSRLTMTVTAPITAMGVASVKAFSDFDNAMTEAFAIMGPMSEDMQNQLRQTARSFDRSKFGPDLLAGGLKNLAAAGLTAEQSMKNLAVVERFATAGAFGLERATTLLTDSQAALGMVSKDATQNMQNLIRVSDALVKAGDQSTASPEQFADALANGAADARNFGMELETIMAVLDAYAMKGNKGAAAGSDLARATRLLSKAVRENGDVFKQMGISVIDQATGEYRNFIDIINDMEKAFTGMTGPQKSAALEMLGFEALAQGAILPLIGMSDAMREWEKQQKSAMGYTERVAKTQLSSFKNEMLAVWNVIKDTGIEIGSILAPGIRFLGQQLAAVLKYWKSLSHETKSATLALLAMAAALGPLLVLLGMTVTLVGGLVAGIAALVAAGQVTLTILAIAAGIGQLAIYLGLATVALMGIVYWLVGPEGMAQAWNSATAAVSNFVTSAVGFLANFSTNMKILMEWLPENWHLVVSDMASAFFVFVFNMNKNLDVGLGIAARLWGAFLGWLGKMFVHTFTVEFRNAVILGVGQSITVIENFGKQIFKTLKNSLTGKKTDTKGFLTQLFEGMGEGTVNDNFFQTARDIIRDGVKDMVAPLDSFESSIVQGPKFVYDTGVKTGAALGEGLAAGAEQSTVEAQKSVEKATLDLENLFKTEATKQEKAIEKLKQKLKEQEATYGMSQAQIDVYRLAQMGATEADVAAAKAIADKLDAQTAEKKQLNEAAKVMEKYQAAAEKVKSPQEKFAAEQKNLQEMLDKGLISAEAFNHEIASMQKDLNKETKIKFSLQGFDSVEYGSMEMLARLDEYKAKAAEAIRIPGAAQAAAVQPARLEARHNFADANMVNAMNRRGADADDLPEAQIDMVTLLEEIAENTKPDQSPQVAGRPVFVAPANLGGRR